MTGEHFKDKDMDSVEKLRNRLKNEMTPEQYADTAMIVRFLKARNYDISASENMLRNNLKWRKENKIDTILEWYKEPEVCSYAPLSRLGFDKEGHIVTYVCYENFDVRGFVSCLTTMDCILYYVNRFERDIKMLEEQSKKLNKNLDKWCYIFNFENLPLSIVTHKPSLQTICKISSVYDSNYPERLKYAIFINASFYFQIGFAVIKPFISGPTIEKIKIFGKDGWKEELLKLIDADVLPAFLGGTRTDPDGDPTCKSVINYGGMIPKKLYAINNFGNFANEPGVRKLMVSRYSKVKVEVFVLYPNSDIEWEFVVKERDISFSLLFSGSKSSNLKRKEVFTKHRIDTSLSPEVGIFKCEEAGFYYLEFDNSYSWIYNKEIQYRVKVISPQQTDAA